ncbi:MAG: diguanylate cyclase [Bacillota bacterium]
MKRLMVTTVAIVILSCLMMMLNGVHVLADQPGYLDLRGTDLHSGLINLDTTWEFYWEQFIAPGEFQRVDAAKPAFVEVPGAWNGYGIPGQELSGAGFATYRLMVRLDPEVKMLGLNIPRIFTSYQIWVNGDLLAVTGEVGQSLEEVTPKYQPLQTYFPAAEEIEIVVQTANFNHRSGGILESFQFGRAEQIQAAASRELAYDLFLFGGLLIMGIYHLIIFFYRKEERSLLYFGLFCLLVSLRTLLVGEIFLLQLFPDISWEVAHKLQTLSYYVGVYVILKFIKAVFPKYVNDKMVVFTALITSAYTLLVLVTPARIFTIFNPGYQLVTVLVIIYLIFAFIRIYKEKVKRDNDLSSIFIMLGAVVLFFTVINDILFLSILKSDYRSIKVFAAMGNLSSLGLFIFVFTDSLALAVKYSEAFQMYEKASVDLSKLNANLGNLVSARTKELSRSRDEIKRQKEDLKQTNRALEMLSNHDALTGIWNRRYFDQTFTEEWNRALRRNKPISLLFIDIDDFKAYNDFYGHQAGDLCLMKIAQEIKRNIRRAGEVVARFGGEEFVVLLPELDVKTAMKTAELIKSRIEALAIPGVGLDKSPVTISIGCSSITPQNWSSREELLGCADQAMYRAKRAGKNQVHLWDG